MPGLWLRWFGWVTLGEAAGFVAPAVVGAVSIEWPDPVMAAALLAAGAIEGAALGWAQAHVLADVVDDLRRGAFVLATAVGAVAAYALALIPVTFGERMARWPAPLLIGTVAVVSVALLATIGTAQWLVLRRLVQRNAGAGSAWWIPATGAAWAAGLGGFFAVAPPLWQPGQPVALVVGIGALGGLVMAAIVAALTGLAAVRLGRAVGFAAAAERAGH